MQVDDAAIEAVEEDVAAVLRHGWAHPGVQQFLNLSDQLVIVVRGRMAGNAAFEW